MRKFFRFLRQKGILWTDIIVTDLTRFANEQIVCLAGIEAETGQCIRPLPYLKASACQRLNIRPGSILSGRFSPARRAVGPHQEDRRYKNLRVKGACGSKDFKAALEAGLFPSLEAGFAIQLQRQQNHIPADHSIDRSIVTIKAKPGAMELLQDRYQPGKLKLNFTDGAGRRYHAMPITDLGFNQFSQRHHGGSQIAGLNAFIQSQPEVYLRVGLGRRWSKPGGDEDEEVHWLQVNGIYTFPDYHRELRNCA